MNQQLVFIASGGRTGTQSFGDLLKTVISDCHSEHEPDMVAGVSRLTLSRISRFGFWHMIAGRLMGQTGVRVLGQKLLQSQIDPDACYRKLRETRLGYHSRLSQPLIIESYYAWWMLADHLADIWPNAKLVGVIRDPRDWIASWQRHSRRRRQGTLTELLPPGPLTPHSLRDDDAAKLWPQLDQIGRLAWEWALIQRTLHHAEKSSEMVRVFRYEDLFLGQNPKLEEFVRFVSTRHDGTKHDVCGLDKLVSQARNASTGKKVSWRAWSDDQVAAVSHFCGPGMAHLGYGQDPDWMDRVSKVRPMHS